MIGVTFHLLYIGGINMSSFMHFSHCHYDYLKVADSSESVISTDALISFHLHNISVFESSSIRHHVNNMWKNDCFLSIAT